jgi:hypothetical protein
LFFIGIFENINKGFMKIILIGCFIVLSFFSNAQGSALQWVKGFGSDSSEVGKKIAVDNLGNLYTLGTCQLTAGASTVVVDFDPGLGTYTLVAHDRDVFISKLDGNGNFIWAKLIETYNGELIPNDIKVDASGNPVVTGYYSGVIDFDPGVGVFNSYHQYGGDYDAFLLKLDANGNFLWERDFGGNTDNDEARELAIDNTGNIYVTGGFYGIVNFDRGYGTNSLTTTGNGDTDVFISKFDSNGLLVWVKQMGGYSFDAGTNITLDNLGNIYTVGGFHTSGDFDPGPGVFTLTGTSLFNDDVFVSKLDGAGNFVWAKVFQTTGAVNSKAVAVDALGNIYLTGNFSDYVDFDPGAGVFNLGNGNVCYHMFISKLDTYGNFGWAMQFGNLTHCGSVDGNDIVTDASNNIYVLAYSGDSLLFSSGTIINASFTALNGMPVYLIKLNTNGALISGNTMYNGNALDIDSQDNLYITGGFHKGLNDFNPSPYIVDSLTSAGGEDVFVLKMSPCTFPPSPTTITSAANLNICSGNSTVLTATSSATVEWFDAFSETAVLGSGNSFVTPTLSVGNYTYYAETYSNCSGLPNQRIAITLTVVPTPSVSISNGTICIGAGYTLTPNGANTYSYSSVTPIVSPSVTTSYTIIGENTIGNCRDTVTAIITVNPNPIISVSNATICAGDPINTSSSGAQTYTVTNGGLPTNVSASYTVTGTDVNGCVDSVGVISQITVLTLPTITVNSNTSICIFSTDTIHLSGALYYGMSPFTSTFFGTYYTVRPTIPTDYVITGQDSFGCQNTTTLTVTVDSTCTYVWPGDANSDGVVDNIDVLDLGLYYAQSGAARSVVSNNWQAYNATSWTTWPSYFSYIRNLCTSDCNGDGIINGDDTLAIFNNYSLTHAFKPAQTTTNPVVTIVPDQSAVAKGTWGTASINLGNITSPISNINGIAFTVNYDNTLLETDSVWLEYPTSFINASNQNLKFRKQNFTNGKLFTATTHTINGNVNGYGKIATLHYKIKSTLATDNVLSLSIAQANQSNASGAITPLTAGSATLMAIGASVGINELTDGSYLSILPNPANDILAIELNTTNDINATIEISNTLGQVVLSSSLKNNKEVLNITHLSNGVYFVKVLSINKQIGFKKIVVQR